MFWKMTNYGLDCNTYLRTMLYNALCADELCFNSVDIGALLQIKYKCSYHCHDISINLDQQEKITIINYHIQKAAREYPWRPQP